MRDTVVSLCDLTGNFVKPWINAGHRAILVDPQHSQWERSDGSQLSRMSTTVEGAMPLLAQLITDQRIAFVAGWPPCTDMSGSGARWWADKREADYMFQAKAVAVAEQCRTVGRLSGAPWFVENPVGALSRVFGKADHTFDPHQFTGWEPGDNYTKKTCLWSGGGFVMPTPLRDTTLGPPDDRIHKAPPSEERGNIRSATPMGFARAVFDANGCDIDSKMSVA